MTYSEPEKWEAFNIHYEATRDDANRLYRKLQQEDCYRRFMVLDTRIRHTYMRGLDPQVAQMIQEHAECYRACSAKVMELLGEGE